MDLNKILTYTLLLFSLHLSGQGLLIKQDGQLIRWDTPTGSTDSLMMFEFDPVDHSRLAFLSDTSDMQLRWSNDTAYVVKWYDVLKRDSLVQATAAFQPRFDFADESVRFDGGQVFTSSSKLFLSISNNNSTVFKYKKENFNDFAYIFFNRLDTSDVIYLTTAFSQTRFSTYNLVDYTRSQTIAIIDEYVNSIATNENRTTFLYENNIVGVNSTAGVTSSPSTDGFVVGSRNGNTPNLTLTGNIRTIMLFDFALNKGQRILTNKYLQK